MIELLVVIAIIAILIALLLPAVQQAREAARRSQCKNNLKQLALALHNYHDSNNVFPYGAAGPGTCSNAPVMNQKGWVQVLPYIDQAPLYGQFDPTQPAGEFVGGGGTLVGNQSALVNAPVVSRFLTAFSCPSDDGDTHYRGTSTSYMIGATSQAAGHNPALTNYDFNIWRSCTSFISQDRALRRMFGLHSCSRIADVKDGTSNTVMLSETTRALDDGEPLAWGVYKHVGDGVDFGIDPPQYRRINDWQCCYWTTPPHSRAMIVGRLGEWGSPGSQHSGGCHVALADGSIRFVSENLDTTTRIRLGRIGDGQPIGEF